MSMRTILAALALLSLSPVVAAADSWDVLRCKLHEGKSFADLEQVLTEWRLIADKATYSDYKVQILAPISGEYTGPGVFFWVGTAPSSQRIGAALDFWFSDPAAARMQEKFRTVFSCENRSTLRTVVQK